MDESKNIRYFIDSIGSSFIRGWVIDQNEPDKVLNCKLKINSVIIDFKNNQKRDDLLTKGICSNGLGGFEIFLNSLSSFDILYNSYISFGNDVFNKLILHYNPLKRLEIQINENKKTVDIKSLTNFFVQVGIDTSNSTNLNDNCVFEVPTRPSHSLLRNCDLGAFSYIGHECRLYNCTIGRYCSIAEGVVIGHGNHPMQWLSTNPFQYQKNFRINNGIYFPYNKKYNEYLVPDFYSIQCAKDTKKERTMIGNDVWIGTNTIILPGIKIGDGAIIGAGSIVTKDVPPYAIVAGSPAKIIRYRFLKEIIKKLENASFWQYSPWDLLENNVPFNNIEDSIETILTLKNRIKPYTIDLYNVKSLIHLHKSLYQQD